MSNTKSIFDDSKKVAGFLLFIGAAQFFTLMMLGEALAPNYSMNTNAISDLGVVHETRAFFNSSMFAIGVTNLIAGFFLYRVHKSHVLLTMFGIASIGAMGAAVFPLDSPVGIHGLFALLAFVFMNIEAIMSAKLVQGALKWTSVAAGFVGLAFVAVMFLVDSDTVDLSGSMGHGGVERMIAYPVLLWMILLGGYLLGGAEFSTKNARAELAKS